MCDFSNGIKFCRCDAGTIKFREKENFRKVNGQLERIPNKKNKNIPLIYIWRLFRFESINKSGEIGRYILPADKINDGLNAEWIALNLNDRNCFDFDYSPQEGDNLIIETNEPMSPYISFIFKNNNWVIEHYDPFCIETFHLEDGIIKDI